MSDHSFGQRAGANPLLSIKCAFATTGDMTSVQIILSCLPEENPNQSAAKDYADRARQKLESESLGVAIEPLVEETANEINDSILVFLVSCGADGSVHRCLRKLVKKMKEANKLRRYYCIALLGHSVCRASAEQLNEQVFGPGRRLAKTLQPIWGDPVLERLEIQVELVAPEVSFDPWIERLVSRIHQLSPCETELG